MHIYLSSTDPGDKKRLGRKDKEKFVHEMIE